MEKLTKEDINGEEYPFSPEYIDSLKKMAKNLYKEMLFVDSTGASAEAEQFFLLAMGSIDQGIRFLEMARLKQSQTLASYERQHLSGRR